MDWNLKKLRTKRAYRVLFLDEHQQLRPEAVAVLDDLYRHARFFKDTSAEPQILAVLEGSRQMLRHIVRQINIVDSEIKRRIKQGVYENEP